ncbi:MAG: hypothetical protein EU536_03570 [Promethearchaeota archaeon]|nr:MAG: hypothetical protein EU536_03570 [Candidatus Lokiarchaeota archaeon]
MATKKSKSCIWNRRGSCSEQVVERLTTYKPDDWSKTTPGKAIESDYSIQYCNFCLMSKLVEQIEELNENLNKIYKKLRPIP